MESLTKQFERQVAVFLGRVRMSPSEFGGRAVGDRKLLGDMRRGRSPQLATAERVLEFMERYDQAADRTARGIQQSAKEVGEDDEHDRT
ncbi:MAG: hypothetical protein OXI46_08505 [Gemmatimonadota bacterium]|nr:hypothetical protein [Gemmatimonadota bacterium]